MEISYKQEVMRKLVHLSSLWMVAAMYFLPRTFCVVLFGSMAALNVLVEYLHYRKTPLIAPLYQRFFGKMLRDGNGKFRLSGSPPFLAAACLTVLVFPREIAVPAFATMLFADTAAALTGRAIGRHKFKNGKSFEGCAAFLVTGMIVVTSGCLLAHYPCMFFITGYTGVAFAMLAELYNNELHLDDNLSIPLLTGGGMALAFLF